MIFLWPLPLVLWLGSSEKNLALSSSHPPTRHSEQSRKITSLDLLMTFFSYAAPDAISLPTYKGSLLVHVQLVFYQGPQFFFCKAAFQTVNSKRSWWPICPDSWCPSESASSHLMYQPLLPVLHCLLSCWGCTQSCYPGHWWRCWAVLVTPAVPGLQLVFVPLIKILWQFSQFSVCITVHLSSLYFISLSMGLLWEIVLKALLKSR